ncbi:MAG: hypothetical protein KTR25_09355 [Myxococcales bacterium]|nr:hypothetical protein [Myxococcales bacterium]
MRNVAVVTKSSTENRRAICRALTNVLVESNLGSQVNSRAFYMLLSSNFRSLMTPSGFDLIPVWRSLVAQTDNDPNLPGLFVALQENLTKHGLESIAPSRIANMPLDARSKAIQIAFGGSNKEALIDQIPAGEISFNTDKIPVLESHELIPLAEPETPPEDLRQEIIHHIIHSLKITPIAKKTNTSRIAFLINENFDSLFDGKNFDLVPILGVFSSTPDYSHRAIYPCIALLHSQLEEMGIGLLVPDLGITPEEGASLLKDAKKNHGREQHQWNSPSSSALQQPIPSTHHRSQRSSWTEHKLNLYGLSRQAPSFWHKIRIGGFSLVLLSTISIAWLIRPDRPLEPTAYALPLKSASLQSGIFVGNLDDYAWYLLRPPQRKELVQLFEQEIRNRGLANNAIIIDDKGRRVLQANYSGQVSVSKFALESPDGIKLPGQGKYRDPLDIAKELSR